MAKLENASALGADAVRLVGSNPTLGTASAGGRAEFRT